MKRIKLTQDKFALVDNEDFEKVNLKKWYFNHGYARNDTKRKRTYMHRFILNPDNKHHVDHKNGNGIDNRKENLRICTISQNMANQKKSRKNTSGFKGVSFHKTLKYWTSSCKFKGKTYVKYSKTKEEAKNKYNEMAKNFFGDFALLN